MHKIYTCKVYIIVQKKGLQSQHTVHLLNMSEWHICMCDSSLSLEPYTFGHLLHENVGWSEWFLCIWSWYWASVMHLYSQNRHANLLLLHLLKCCSKLDFDENDFSHSQHLHGASHVSKCIFRFLSVREDMLTQMTLRHIWFFLFMKQHVFLYCTKCVECTIAFTTYYSGYSNTCTFMFFMIILIS